MKNKTIFILVNSGILNTTANTASDRAAYELYKFKKNLASAYENIISQRDGLLKESGVKVTGKDTELNDRAKGLLDKLFEDETEIKCKPIDYKDWRMIQKENASQNVFVGFVERELEGIFWNVPEFK